MAAVSTPTKRAEIKIRTADEVRNQAKAVYAHWGITLNDAINMFLVKSIEVGGLPFDLKPEVPSYDSIAAFAYKPQINAEGIAVLPSDWDDDE